MNQYKINNYDEVINDMGTYRVIAGNLKRGFSTFIGWTDNDSTHYDILFTYGCTGEGCYQRGLRITDLFVSIMSVGSFGFKTDSPKDVAYVAEKLFNSRIDDSVERVTQLINGIIGALKELG